MHKRHENEALKMIIMLYEQGDQNNTIIAQLFASGYQLLHTTDIEALAKHEAVHLSLRAPKAQSMTKDQAMLLVRALILFNDKPRFGPRNRRLHFDSYSVASEIESTLRACGYDPRDVALQPEAS